MPGRSSLRSASRRESSLSVRALQVAAMTATGTLNQNTQCHEISTSAPPRTGPMTKPIAATIEFVPIATPSCSSGKASATSAGPLAKMNAPAIP